MGIYKSLCGLIGPYWSLSALCVLTDLFRSLCVLMGSHVSLFVLTSPYGSLYVLMDSNVTLLVLIGFYAFLCVLKCPNESL